ncbi:EAL domain-containing protein [Marinomonas dokdonensis]|uniref:EAL domain-containing protein n=1 Tax=Marinomonas dokdonensis TaxID=328224 RepID=UPI0040556975
MKTSVKFHLCKIFLLVIGCYHSSLFAEKLETVRLQLKAPHSFQFAGYYAAKKLGYYRQQGLEVEILPAKFGQNIIEEVASGRAQYGVGDEDLLIARDRGFPVVLMASIFQHTAAALLVNDHILSLRDWHDKRFMISPDTAALLAFLKENGIELKQIKLVEHTFDIQDLIDGNVDAIGVDSPLDAYFLETMHFPYKIFTPRSLGIDFLGDNLFTSQKEIDNHANRVTAFREASIKGWQYALENQAIVIDWIFNDYDSFLSKKALEFEANALYPLLEPNLIPLGYINQERWENMATTYFDVGLIQQPSLAEDFFYSPPSQPDYSIVYIVLTVTSCIIIALSMLAIFVMRTNRRLDAALEESRHAEQRIWQQANFDSLTKLPNRHFFRTSLDKKVTTALEKNEALTLFYLDLDRFKEVNDIHGHDEGDKILIQATSRMENRLPHLCTVSRLGGDEFTIIIENIKDRAGVEAIAQRLLSCLRQPFRIGSERIFLSASIGISQLPEHCTDADSLIKYADEAMYAAKHLGRNQFHWFTKELHDNVLNRIELISDLRTAIKNHDFSLVYQPIIDLQSHRIIKVEALIRWQHAKKGFISPAVFIPMAEEAGLINEIGDFVFRSAISQLADWRNSIAPNLMISINTSPAQYLNEPSIMVEWFDLLHELTFPENVVTLEITESMLMHNKDAITTQLLAFRDQGIQVALDDFGTGYSSLAYLNRFDIDFIKIDQSFVKSLALNNSEQTLCEAIIDMAKKLGLKVIAEGIETNDQMNILKTAGCQFGQGYYLSYPLTANAITDLLIQQKLPSPKL